MIVVVAGLLGLFLLARGGSNSLLASGTPSGGASKVTSTVPNVPTIAPPTTVAAAPPSTRAPSEVNIAIYNATKGAVATAAGNAKSKLSPFGYTNVSIDDAPDAIKQSAVLYAAGYQADAQAIADTLGFDRGAVAPADGAKNNPGAGKGASIVVVIGTDTVGKD